ncbi:hypothetical protein [Tuberibacillus sp. Marseille-P3662]|uniref:hypothetical protein n=1 Tax=Tuberibacillus sp. Marseille-P3662 TaxID=1965358 RepID=UPI001593216C|nr:hypothetical protein [Tuberibacillus sp. Marseille-P3662]
MQSNKKAAQGRLFSSNILPTNTNILAAATITERRTAFMSIRRSVIVAGGFSAAEARRR